MEVSSGEEKREREKEGAPFFLSLIPSLPPPPSAPLLTQANSLKAYYSGTPPYGHLVNTANFFWPNGGRINGVPLYSWFSHDVTKNSN